jgi:hypothetical protein
VLKGAAEVEAVKQDVVGMGCKQKEERERLLGVQGGEPPDGVCGGWGGEGQAWVVCSQGRSYDHACRRRSGHRLLLFTAGRPGSSWAVGAQAGREALTVDEAPVAVGVGGLVERVLPVVGPRLGVPNLDAGDRCGGHLQASSILRWK